MKFYEIKPNYSDEKQNFLDAAHRWGLPGVSCSVCDQIWAGCGLEYPSVDISELLFAGRLEEGWVASLEEFEYFKSEIQRSFPECQYLQPGTRFGNLVGDEVGKKSGHLNDFMFHMHWTVVVKGTALEKLRSARLNLPKTIEATINFKTIPEVLFEFEIPPIGTLINPIYEGGINEACSACGRIGVSKPEKIIVEKSSLLKKLDIFRLRNFATMVLVSERFVESVNKLNLSGAIFKKVELS